MRSNKKVSKFCDSKGNFRFVDVACKNFCHYLLACTCAPLLFGSLAMASTPVRQDIAQVISVGTITRPSLKVGSKGNAVNELQAALKLLGFYDGVVNGEYDNATATSVSQFRQAAGLPADSSVDEKVWQKLFPSEVMANTSPLGSSVTPPPPTSTNPFPIPTQTANPPIPNQNIMSVVNPAPEPRPATPAPQNTQRSSTSTTVRTTNNNTTQRSSTSTSTRSSNNNTSQRSSTSTSTRSTSPATQPTTNQRRPASRQPVSFPNFTQKPNIQYTSEGRPILRPGMRGEEVTFLQQRLRALGYLSSPADGDFGAATESAVKALQKRFGLESDAVVGGATWNVLLR